MRILTVVRILRPDPRPDPERSPFQWYVAAGQLVPGLGLQVVVRRSSRWAHWQLHRDGRADGAAAAGLRAGAAPEAVADRVDRRALLIGLYLAAALLRPRSEQAPLLKTHRW
jgi:hypothetical protein